MIEYPITAQAYADGSDYLRFNPAGVYPNAVADFPTGWNVKLVNPPAYQVLTSGTVRNIFSATPLPVADPTVNGDCWVTLTPETRTFGPGTWIFAVAVAAYVQGGGVGRARTRLWRSPLNSGVGATAVTDVQVHSIVGPLTLNQPAVSLFSVSLSELVLVGEYLMLQMAWEITTAGSALSDVKLYLGPTAVMAAPEAASFPVGGAFRLGYK